MFGSLRRKFKSAFKTWEIARMVRRNPLAVWESHRDRSSHVETWASYGQGMKVAERDSITQYDLQADEVNSNVKVAVRAISDAIRSLPMRAMMISVADGEETEEEDAGSLLAEWIDRPNLEHDISEIMAHTVKCYLLDGNSFHTIESNVGPFKGVEIWPRDPRQVKVIVTANGQHGGYKVGEGEHAISYKRDRVIHVRDIDPNRPFYGESRIQGIRDEIALDWYVNQLNTAFFKNGGIINLMFVPKKKLDDIQHKQLLDALKADLTGVERMFKMFINKYPGELVYPDIKHKDILFGDLLRMNREKIYAAFGLPPFRGGVMEYANYANALMQDRDFWNNTIKPILLVIESAFNRWFVQPRFGMDMRLRFDTSDVPALRGDPKEQAEIAELKAKTVIDLYSAGVMTIEEAREALEMPKQTATRMPATRKMEARRNAALVALRKMTNRGSDMWMLDGSKYQTRKMFDIAQYNEADAALLTLSLRQAIYIKTCENGNGSALESYAKIDKSSAIPLIVRVAQEHNRHLFNDLDAMLSIATKQRTSYAEVVKQIRQTLSNDRAQRIESAIASEIDKWAVTIANGDKNNEAR